MKRYIVSTSYAMIIPYDPSLQMKHTLQRVMVRAIHAMT